MKEIPIPAFAEQDDRLEISILCLNVQSIMVVCEYIKLDYYVIFSYNYFRK